RVTQDVTQAVYHEIYKLTERTIMQDIYYEIAGEGETVVLVHAGFLDSGMWDAQWEALTQQYRVLRYDLRGYGKSAPIQGEVNWRAQLYELLQHVGIEKAAFIGCSLGGEVISDFALEHPDMVSALVVVSATPSGFELQGE